MIFFLYDLHTSEILLFLIKEVRAESPAFDYSIVKNGLLISPHDQQMASSKISSMLCCHICYFFSCFIF